jgi:hypothetical protein
MDQWEIRKKIIGVTVVTTTWLVAAMTPLILLSVLPLPDGAALVVPVLFVAYCYYTGYRAWRRNWRSRFVLRVVVPSALFSVVFVAAGVLAWN